MGSLVQFVCFTTLVQQDEFLQAWDSFASGFLSRGIERIVLSENTDRSTEAAFDFVSRHLWDAGRFERAFPHGVRGSGGLGAIGLLQAGAFRIADAVSIDPADGQRDDVKVVAFFMTRTGQREAARSVMRSALTTPDVAASIIYLKDGDARTDRFDTVVEAYCDAASADAIATRIVEASAPFRSAQPIVIGTYQDCAGMAMAGKRA